MSIRKGLKKKQDDAAKYAGCIVDPSIGDMEIVWASITIDKKDGTSGKSLIVYSMGDHDNSINLCLIRLKIRDTDVVSIEIKRLKTLGETAVIKYNEAVKWKLKKK